MNKKTLSCRYYLKGEMPQEREVIFDGFTGAFEVRGRAELVALNQANRSRKRTVVLSDDMSKSYPILERWFFLIEVGIIEQ